MPTRNEADYLIVSLLLLPELRQSAIESLDGLSLFDNLVLPAHAIIWDGIRRLAPVCENDRMATSSVGCEIVSRNTSPNDEEVVREAVEMLNNYADTEVSDINVVYAGRILEAFLVQARKASMMMRLSEVTNLDDLSAFVDNGSKEVSRIGITGEPDIEDPLSDPDKFMPERIPIPTGVDWIDYLSGGGHCSGELIGVLGPQGGGKTMTATSMLIAQAKQRRHCLLLTYEQSVLGDVSNRLYTRLFNDNEGDLMRDLVDSRHPELRGKRVDVEFFRRYRYSEWPDIVKERYKELNQRYGAYVHSMDFAKDVDIRDPKPQGTRGVKDIEAVLDVLEKRGQKVDFVIIDWLWPAVTRWFYNQTSTRIGDELKAAVQFLYALKAMTEKKNVVTFVFHQLDSEHTRSSPQVQPNCTNAWNIKSFSQVMVHCYVIGNRDKESQVMWLGNDKARTGAPQYILGKMDGAMGIINRTDGYELCRGRFVEKGSGVPSDDIEEERPSAMSRYL